MSQLLIQHYLNELQTLRRVSGTQRESVVREAFKTLLKDWGRSHDLIFLPEHEYETLTKNRVYPDGTLMYALRVPFGYWEAKDTDDDLDEEIEKKFRKGYPQDNIIFDDSHEAVLIQNKQQVMRCGVEDPPQLQKLLELYFSYERPEIADFRAAVEQFKADLPAVLTALRDMIDAAERNNPPFHQAAIKFLKHAQETINPNVVAADVREIRVYRAPSITCSGFRPAWPSALWSSGIKGRDAALAMLVVQNWRRRRKNLASLLIRGSRKSSSRKFDQMRRMSGLGMTKMISMSWPL